MLKMHAGVYICELTSRWVPAHCVQVDSTVVEHEFML